jgi:hypothetical protein
MLFTPTGGGSGGIFGALDAIPIIGPIIGGLLGWLFGPPDLSGAVNQLQTAVSQLVDQVQTLMDRLVKVLKTIGGLFNSVWDFLKHVWEDYIKKALQWLASHIAKIIDWLRKHLKSLLDHLKAWKKWYDQHILPQQLRMIAMIQNVRRFLGILSLFHVKWAQKLDATLADIQNRMVQTVLLIENTFNQIINTLAIAFDPSLLLRTNVLGASLLGSLAAVKRILGYGGQRALTGAEAALQLYESTRYKHGGTAGHVNALAAGGLTAQDQTERTQARAALTAITGSPNPLPG